VGGATSLLTAMTVKGAAVTATRTGQRSAGAVDYPIVAHGACPGSLAATATVASNPHPSRAHLEFTLRLYYEASRHGRPPFTAVRSYGARSLDVAGLAMTSVNFVTARPAVLTHWTGSGVTNPNVQIAADVANAQQCSVTSRLVDAGGRPGDAVANLNAFKSIVPVSGRAVDCATTASVPVRVASALTVPPIELARGATCGDVTLDVVFDAAGHGGVRQGHVMLNVHSGRGRC